MLHSDRGFLDTSQAFETRITTANMTQSMSRVVRCIDNGPMEFRTQSASLLLLFPLST